MLTYDKIYIFKSYYFTDPGKQSPGPGFNPANPLSALEMTRLALFKMYNQAGLPGSPGNGPQPPQGLGSFGQAMGQEMGRAMAEQHARALQAVREAEERDKKEEAESIEAEKRREKENDIHKEDRDRPDGERHREREHDRSDREHRVRPRTPDEDVLLDGEEDDVMSPPPMKRERSDSVEGRTNGGGAIGGANIRIASRGK